MGADAAMIPIAWRALQMPFLVVPPNNLIQEFSHVANTHQVEFEANETESFES